MFKRVVGAMSGTIDFQNEQRRVYLGDLNNNGRWLDSSDRIFLDVNGDGRISRITERLESTGIINIRGELYSVQANSVGSEVRLKRVTATGQIGLKLNLKNKDSTVSRLSAVLRSETGIKLVVTDINETVECPVGNYQVDRLLVFIDDQQQQFSFCLLYTSPSPRDRQKSRMPSSA